MISSNVKEGVQQAPHRSLFNALGFTKEEMKKPMIGVVCSYNEIVPGHMNLDKIANAVKLGIAEAGGMPVMFPAIAVCDGIAMGHVGMKYSLVTRDLIADSTECMAKAHQFDGLVMIPNCDKNVPGLLMAAARVNIPTVFVSGGPMLAGHVNGRKRSLSSMFEAVGEFDSGKITAEEPDGGNRNGTSRKRNDSGSIFGTYPPCEGGRICGHGYDQKEYPPAGHHDKDGLHQCNDGGYGAWMFHEYHAASSCHRA